MKKMVINGAAFFSYLINKWSREKGGSKSKRREGVSALQRKISKYDLAQNFRRWWGLVKIVMEKGIKGNKPCLLQAKK